MQFAETPLHGAWLIEPEPHFDERGWFARCFCENEFCARALTTRFVQHSRSYSRFRGTLRGMHFQEAPHGEEKLVSCLAGAIFDVIGDLRRDSPTYLQTFGVELSATNGRQLYIPKGVAHGFQALTDGATVNYLISEFYAPASAAGLRYDDPVLGIKWPLAPTMVSDRDLSWPLWEPRVPRGRYLPRAHAT